MSNKTNNKIIDKEHSMPKIEQRGFPMPKPAPPSSYTQQSNNQTANQNSTGGKKK